jgi:hypothetical protein
MFPKVLSLSRAKIRGQAYVITIHADEAMAEDDLLPTDVESVILSGKIVERQIDRSTGERKYRVVGETCEGEPAEVVVKFGLTGKAIVMTVIYVYEDRFTDLRQLRKTGGARTQVVALLRAW